MLQNHLCGKLRALKNSGIMKAMSDLKTLTEAMHSFVTAKGWYEANSPRQQTARNMSISLCLEAAEVLEHFQWSDSATDKDALASELADVALYLLQLASVNDIDLEQAIYAKLEQNYGRSWDEPKPAAPLEP